MVGNCSHLVAKLKPGLFLLTSLALVVSLTLNQSFADSSSPTPSSTDNLSYDSVCGNSQIATTNPSEFAQYCQAAKKSQQGADADDTLWKVWTAVTAVCVASCAAPFLFGRSNPWFCITSTAGAATAEAVMTQDIAGAFTALAAAGGSLLVNSMMNSNNKSQELEKTEQKADEEHSTESDKPKKPVDKDFGSCLAALADAAQVFTDHSQMITDQNDVQTNLQSALSLKTTVPTNSGPFPQIGPGGSPLAVAPAPETNPINSTQVATAPTSSASNSPIASTCSAAVATGNTGDTLSCAIASDSSLPPLVSSPQFADQFKKASGMDLGSFLATAGNPESALIAGVANTTNPAQSSKLASAISALDSRITSPNSAYRGGGSYAHTGNEADPSADLISGMMSQLFNKSVDGNVKADPLSTLAFNAQSRSPANLEENRTISLFDRISARYLALGQQFLEGGL